MKRPIKKADVPPIGDRLLTLREAADVQGGEIEGRIIGGRWKFRRADLDAFYANAPRNWAFAGKNFAGDGEERIQARSAEELRSLPEAP